jgi:hypothetical protein
MNQEGKGMRNSKLVLIMLVILAATATAALAGAPFDGVYKSSDGDFNEGREASWWMSVFGLGSFLSTGNVLHAESWDGSTLGTDWKILCPMVVKVTLIADMTSGGWGQRIYQLDYAGGYLELSGAGPWGNGDALYTNLIDTYYEFRTIQYEAGLKTGSVSDHLVTAHSNIYKKCFTWGIGNGVWLGEGDPPPIDYPEFRENRACRRDKFGHWGDIRDLTLTIQGCTVSTETSSWGAVKAMYR